MKRDDFSGLEETFPFVEDTSEFDKVAPYIGGSSEIDKIDSSELDKISRIPSFPRTEVLTLDRSVFSRTDSSNYKKSLENILRDPASKFPINFTDLGGFKKEAIQTGKGKLTLGTIGKLAPGIMGNLTKLPMTKGTTTLAFIFKKGVILAAENISSQPMKKIVEINPYMLGAAANYRLWHKDLVKKCCLYKRENNSEISVTGASVLLFYLLASYSKKGLSVGTMIAGWDEKRPGLYLVDSVDGRVKVNNLCMGSGIPYAEEVLHNGYRFDLSVEEAAELARQAIYRAKFPDGANGGVANVASVYHVGPDGWKKVLGDDVVEAAAAVEHEMTDVPIA